MERIYVKDDPRPLLSPIYLGPQKENNSANIESTTYSRHEQDFYKADSSPDVNNEFLFSDLRFLSTHLLP